MMVVVMTSTTDLRCLYLEQSRAMYPAQSCLSGWGIVTARLELLPYLISPTKGHGLYLMNHTNILMHLKSKQQAQLLEINKGSQGTGGAKGLWVSQQMGEHGTMTESTSHIKLTVGNSQLLNDIFRDKTSKGSTIRYKRMPFQDRLSLALSVTKQAITKDNTPMMSGKFDSETAQFIYPRWAIKMFHWKAETQQHTSHNLSSQNFSWLYHPLQQCNTVRSKIQTDHLQSIVLGKGQLWHIHRKQILFSQNYSAFPMVPTHDIHSDLISQHHRHVNSISWPQKLAIK